MTAIPKELTRVGKSGFKIVWEDGHESAYAARELRLSCPCAGCRQEWTGESLIEPGSIPADVGLRDARLVGQYAVQFVFSDGHGTGIFTFDLLRRLCRCPVCQKSP